MLGRSSTVTRGSTRQSLYDETKGEPWGSPCFSCQVRLIKGMTHSRDNLTLEIVQVLKGKGLLRIAAPSDGYLKRLVFTAASLNSL